MTQIQSVARADKPQVSSASVRISEMVEGSISSAMLSQPPLRSDILRTGYRYIQAGWRWLERRCAQQVSSRRLRLTETISLGEKRSVSIVSVDGSQFLIGCSAGSVQLLAALDRQHGAVMKDLSDTPNVKRAS